MKDLEPLEDDLARMFRDEPMPLPPDGAQARVLRRLGGTTPPGASGGGGPSGSGGVPGKSSRSVGARAITLVGSGFVAGAVVGGALVAALVTSRAPASEVVRPSPVASASAASSGDPQLPIPSSAEVAYPVGALADSPLRSSSDSSKLPSANSGRPPAATASTGLDELAIERAILDDARTFLANGEANSALLVLADHARRFPHARLGEEREALAVQALVNAGRYDEARARAAAFRRQSPGSVYLDAIDVTLRSIP